MPGLPDFKGSVDAVGRCKQCGAPVTLANKVAGPTGLFCSDVCRAKHEDFVQRTAQLEQRGPGGLSIGFLVRRLVRSAVALVVLLALVGAVSVLFEIPVLAPFFRGLFAMVGLRNLPTLR